MAILDFIKDDSGGKKLCIALVSNTSSSGKSPFTESFRKKAKRYGYTLVEETVELNAIDAEKQVKNISAKKADYAIIQGNIRCTAAILKSAAANTFQGKLIGLNGSSIETIIPILGRDCENFLGVPLYSQWDEKKDEIKKIQEYVDKKNGYSIKKNLSYIAGWATGLIMARGISLSKDLTSGEKIKAGFEKIKKFNADGLCQPITYSLRAHHGQESIKIYSVKNGIFAPISAKAYK